MRVLHLSTGDSGGAALACIRLHAGLRSCGIDSKVLVLQKEASEEEVYRYEEPPEKRSRWAKKILSFILLPPRLFKIPLSRAQYYLYRLERLRRGSAPFFTLPFSDRDLTRHPLVRAADVIHLHWVAGFIDYPSFFKKINKPVVWTVRDENPFLGGFHYRIALSGTDHRYRALDEELRKAKKKSVARCGDLTVIFLSRMMTETYGGDELVAGRKVHTIPSFVDHRVFRPLDRETAQGHWGIPRGKKVICFVSVYLEDERKGLKELLQAVRRSGRTDLLVLAIGEGKSPLVSGVDCLSPGRTDDPAILSLAYSAADLFVLPSFQEGFAKTPLEAMACGVPVVAFPCSGTEELINEKNGVRTADFTVESLKDGIEKALDIRYDGKWIRNDIIERFGIDKIVAQYVDVYRQVLT